MAGKAKSYRLRRLRSGCIDFLDGRIVSNMEQQSIEKEVRFQTMFRWMAADLISVVVAFVITWFAQDVGLNDIMFAFWLNWLPVFWAKEC